MKVNEEIKKRFASNLIKGKKFDSILKKSENVIKKSKTGIVKDDHNGELLMTPGEKKAELGSTMAVQRHDSQE